MSMNVQYILGLPKGLLLVPSLSSPFLSQVQIPYSYMNTTTNTGNTYNNLYPKMSFGLPHQIHPQTGSMLFPSPKPSL